MLVKTTLDLEKKSDLTEEERNRLSSLRDEEIDFSEIPESDDDFLAQGTRWNRHAFEREWIDRRRLSRADLELSYLLWTLKPEKTTLSFETFWNLKAYAFLKKFHPDAFALYPSFGKSVGRMIIDRSEKLAVNLSKNSWPWSLHHADTMGSVGVAIDPESRNPIPNCSMIAFGLLDPMEHLAFLHFVRRKDIAVLLNPETQTVNLTPLPGGGKEKEEDSSFPFHYNNDPNSLRFAAYLEKNLGHRTAGQVTILIPCVYESWLEMRKSYEESRPWKNYVPFAEVLRFGTKTSAVRTLILKSGKKVLLEPEWIVSPIRFRTNQGVPQGIYAELPAFCLAS